jgi:hypothetical protein
MELNNRSLHSKQDSDVDEITKQLGLLMETADNQQKLAKQQFQLAEMALDRLQQQTQALGDVILKAAREQ